MKFILMKKMIVFHVSQNSDILIPTLFNIPNQIPSFIADHENKPPSLLLFMFVTMDDGPIQMEEQLALIDEIFAFFPPLLDPTTLAFAGK